MTRPAWFTRYVTIQRVLNEVMRAVVDGDVTTVRQLAALSGDLTARELPGDRKAAELIRQRSQAMVPLLPPPPARRRFFWR